MNLKRLIPAAIVVAGVTSGTWLYVAGSVEAAPEVRTSKVTRGDIVQTVQGTGTLGAVTTVTVGSQVSGVVSWLGADFNSVVHKGQVIVRLDPALLDAQILQARASQTKVAADVHQQEVHLADSRTKLERAAKLSANGLVSTSDLDAATLAVSIAESELQSVRASLVQADAALNQAQVNLSRASISSPIDGVVIQRSVDVGQTVAASLSSPELFLIAADLGDMQALAQIDETDISKVSVGQPVTVKVDAYPNETFSGEVSQIRLQPQVVSNVTTYSAIVDVPNPDLRLKPGMTASVTIEVARKDDVLRVQNAALRFTPTDATFALIGSGPAISDAAGGAASTRDAVLLTSVSYRVTGATPAPTKHVWVRADDGLQAVPVVVGLSDSTYTEIVASDLAAGEALVLSVTAPASSVKSTTAQANPLIGTSPSGRGRGL